MSLLLASCMHMGDTTLLTTCDPQVRQPACNGINVHNVKLIIHVPIYMSSDEFDIERIVEYVTYAQTFFYNANIVFESVEIVRDMPPYHVSYNTAFENIEIFHETVIEDPRGIHIFVVNSINNIKKPDSQIVGLQYAKTLKSCTSAIFITGDVSRQTFVHELGHYFGLRHVVDPNNIMHRGEIKRSEDATFYESQYVRMNTNAKFVVDYCIRDVNYHVK